MAFSTMEIGGSPKSLDGGGGYEFTRVRVIDSNTGDIYEAGTSGGRTFVVKTDVYASQEFAQWLLDNMAWRRYADFEATRAEVDPAAEIGDYIVDYTDTPNRLSGAMYKQNINFGSGYSDIGSPGYEELDGEYTSKTDLDRARSYTERAITQALGEVGSALQIRFIDSPADLPDGWEQTNVLYVVRAAKSTVLLDSLTVEYADLKPAFNSYLFEYTIKPISSYYPSVTITADPKNPAAKAKITARTPKGTFTGYRFLSIGSGTAGGSNPGLPAGSTIEILVTYSDDPNKDPDEAVYTIEVSNG